VLIPRGGENQSTLQKEERRGEHYLAIADRF
jgi:hypothetical protein